MTSTVCTRVKTSPDYLQGENGELLVEHLGGVLLNHLLVLHTTWSLELHYNKN